MNRRRFPGGKRFAFTVFDDCDNATVANTRPFYRLLEHLGMRTTKTVWSLGAEDVHPNWVGSSTLEDPEYRDFARELQAHGFEIASHGVSMMSATRSRTLRGIELFAGTFGHPPRTHANHGDNRDNLYWLDGRFRSRLLGLLYRYRAVRNGQSSEGHVPRSPYFWGDLGHKHIDYVRGFTFPATDLLSVHPRPLYADAATPFVNFWFSACHAPSVAAFNALLRPERQERLVRAGGISIVATHVAAGFVEHGEVRSDTRALLEALAARDGWFVPVATLLDHLRAGGLGGPLPAAERRRVELRWLFSAARRGAGS
ncbi:MAG: hypothetical protein HYV93_01805 [Candidatus Rokubacteria bacterium]|nr:hypothetical protein [Candidatus Rokubacteria bacterium]